MKGKAGNIYKNSKCFAVVSGSDGDTYRWQRRGGFTFADDAGVAFRHHEHGVMRALVTNNVYDFETADKLKILSTLCSQLLTYATTRDIIDDGFDRYGIFKPMKHSDTTGIGLFCLHQVLFKTSRYPGLK